MMRHCASKLRQSFLALAVLVIFAPGCAPEPYPKRPVGNVTGTVSYQGEPVSMGVITFQPESGAPVIGEIQGDGTYRVEAVVGPNRVMIVCREPEDLEADSGEAATERPQPKNLVPDQYGGPNSGLSVEVEAGDNEANFELK